MAAGDVRQIGHKRCILMACAGCGKEHWVEAWYVERGLRRWCRSCSDRRGAERTKGYELKFKCRFCGARKPLADMRLLTRFFPQVAACKDCEKKIA